MDIHKLIKVSDIKLIDIEICPPDVKEKINNLKNACIEKDIEIMIVSTGKVFSVNTFLNRVLERLCQLFINGYGFTYTKENTKFMFHSLTKSTKSVEDISYEFETVANGNYYSYENYTQLETTLTFNTIIDNLNLYFTGVNKKDYIVSYDLCIKLLECMNTLDEKKVINYSDVMDLIKL